jgi:hypothetical protein
MPPTFQEQQAANKAATTTTLAIPDLATMLVGDLLIGLSGVNGLNALINQFPTSGWTSQGNTANGAGSQTMQVVTKIADANDVALLSLQLMAVRGVSQSTPINKFSITSQPSGLTQTAPSVTPTVEDTLILCGFGIASVETALASSDLTMRNNTAAWRNNMSVSMGTALGPAAGGASGTKAATWTGTAGAGFVFTMAIVAPSTDITPPAVPQWSTPAITIGEA